MKKKLYIIHMIACIILFIISFTISFFLPETASAPYSYIGPVGMLFFGHEIKNADKEPKRSITPMRTFFIGIGKPNIYRTIVSVLYAIFLISFPLIFVKELILLFS